MTLFTERHGIRNAVERTFIITVEKYFLLLDCCTKYYKNLIHMFYQEEHHDFTAKDYTVFSRKKFQYRIKSKIPSLYCDEYGQIATPEVCDEYDQYALLDLIEFVAQNIKDIYERWNSKYKDFIYTDELETSEVFLDYQKEINDIFEESGLQYMLTDDKIIERIVDDSTLAQSGSSVISAIPNKSTRDILQESISMYKNPRPEIHKNAVEKIWDALESLKTHYPEIEKNQFDEKLAIKMSNGDEKIKAIIKTELSQLGNIGNNFRIRHFNATQIESADERHYDYFFNRCLALIVLAIKYMA